MGCEQRLFTPSAVDRHEEFSLRVTSLEQVLSPRISPYLPVSPHTSLEQVLSPRISPYLPVSPHTSLEQVLRVLDTLIIAC